MSLAEPVGPVNREVLRSAAQAWPEESAGPARARGPLLGASSENQSVWKLGCGLGLEIERREGERVFSCGRLFWLEKDLTV